RARLIDGRRRPARPQRRYYVTESVERVMWCLRERGARQRGDRQRPTDEVNPGGHGQSEQRLGRAHRSSSSLGVGGDLHVYHAIGFTYRLALLHLLTSPHTEKTPADSRVLAVERRRISKHYKELAFCQIFITASARHADDPALERHIGEFGRQIGIFRAA